MVREFVEEIDKDIEENREENEEFLCKVADYINARTMEDFLDFFDKTEEKVLLSQEDEDAEIKYLGKVISTIQYKQIACQKGKGKGKTYHL